ncbi:DeoR/GlpR family DNA-binding transcription regulator [Clostridium sp. Marseille-P2415]|uniref:DeoR/GlpR family DNA-binding transcription regulator n=1 Tax=Clostridium sp. Marseille-P2415 TaxID=1805471 RepID=UPI0009885ED1|nr:DeoR/GlpR family DNA-binding transcription regulator [Clostridium sp. Marseille-P2415]
MINKRMEFILQELEEKSSIRVADVSKQLECSEVTIRNDIQKLEEMGLLNRIHGGATKAGAQVVVLYNAETVYKNADKKQRIAEKAYEYIEDNDTIILDDASTSYYLARIIKENPSKHLLVITNSLVAAGELSDARHVNLFLLGGQVGGKLSSTMGDATIGNLEECHADKAFISAHGINFDVGITSIGSPQMQVKKAILKASKEVYLLVDSSKFGGGYVLVVSPLSEITRIITDNEIKKEYLEMAHRDHVAIDIV